MSRYTAWALMVICWDGILPLVVSQVGPLMRLLLPDNDSDYILVAVLVIAGAFVLRYRIGARLYDQPTYADWQAWVFILGLFFLLLLDALLLAMTTVGDAATDSDWGFIGMAYAIYLSIMALALFPFHAKHSSSADDLEEWI